MTSADLRQAAIMAYQHALAALLLPDQQRWMAVRAALTSAAEEIDRLTAELARTEPT